MERKILHVLFLGIVIGFAIHGLAVQFMNKMIVWKIVAHTFLLVYGAISAALIFRQLLRK